MLRRFFSYYRPYKGLFLVDFGCAVLAGLLELGFPIAVNQFVDKLLPSGDWSIIMWACLGLLAVYGLNTLMQFVVTYWGHKLGINIETDMRSKLFNHLQKLSFRFYDNHKIGNLQARMTNSLMEIGEVAHHGPEDLFIAVMTLVGAFLLMLSVNVKMAIITVLVVPVLIWVAGYFSGKMSRTFGRMFNDLGEFNARMEENIGGIRVVQSFANEEHEKKLFAVSNNSYRLTKMISYKIMAKSSSISYMLMRLVTIFVLVCGAYFVMKKELTYGEFVGFLLLSNVFLAPIQKISSIIETYPKGIAGFKQYVELLDTEPDIQDAKDAVDVKQLRGDIVFEDVSFGYEDDATKILEHIHMHIQAGETVAFVGPSGAGKTTLCSLLPRFYEVDGGRITVDGLDIRGIQLQSLRKQIGIVQQDVFLFNGTIRENIQYGKLDASEAKVWEAVRRAQLEPFIRSLPEELDTVIGERGVKLSGGQKQRLAIGRMFLKNPPILILDEATSALDTETEAAIQKSLNELSKGRTTLIIAHRLATIKNADRIIVVTERGIEEQGAHEELVARGGVYSRLHQAQYGGI